MRFHCRRCDAPVSNELEPLFDASKLVEEDGEAHVPAGTFALSDGDYYYGSLGVYLLNLDDAVDTRHHRRADRLYGCCGLDGGNGPNTLCRKRHEIGTEKSDCWHAHALLLDPRRVRRRPDERIVYVLCGLSFAGKSTLAGVIAEHTGAAIVSLDAINAKRGLYGGEGVSAEEWGRTHDLALEQLDRLLGSGQAVVVDDTSCFRFLRDNYRAVARRRAAPCVVLHVDVPLETALARRAANDDSPTRATVTEAILRDLARTFERPEADETTWVLAPRDDPSTWVRRALVGARRPRRWYDFLRGAGVAPDP
ncbi:MAG: ATP-binding protein [Acidobacteriota bacterium]